MTKHEQDALVSNVDIVVQFANDKNKHKSIYNEEAGENIYCSCKWLAERIHIKLT